MALITCSECGKFYSDKADACPSCGCPTSLQTQASSQTPEKSSTPKIHSAPSSLAPTNDAHSSNTNSKPGITGIIAVIAGSIIALSTGLITGSEEYNYWDGNRMQTDISRTDGEKLAANGILAVGILTSLIGTALLIPTILRSIQHLIPSSDSIHTLEKEEIFNSLIPRYLNSEMNTKGVPNLEKSELVNNQLIVKGTLGETLCVFERQETEVASRRMIQWTMSSSG